MAIEFFTRHKASCACRSESRLIARPKSDIFSSKILSMARPGSTGAPNNNNNNNNYYYYYYRHYYYYYYYRSCRELSYCIKAVTIGYCNTVSNARKNNSVFRNCGKQKMSAKGHGWSVTMNSTPTVLQWQSCVGCMSCFLLEERLSRVDLAYVYNVYIQSVDLTYVYNVYIQCVDLT